MSKRSKYDGMVWWVMTPVSKKKPFHEVEGCVAWIPVFREETAARDFAKDDMLQVIAGRVLDGVIDE